jgi:hypothetical protein
MDGEKEGLKKACSRKDMVGWDLTPALETPVPVLLTHPIPLPQ